MPLKGYWIKTPQLYSSSLNFYLNQFELNAKPDSFILTYASKNQIKIFINSVWVISNYKNENEYFDLKQLDISKWLKKGKNTIIVEEFNEDADFKEVSQLSHSGFFINTTYLADSTLTINKNWHFLVNQSITSMLIDSGFSPFYKVGEKVKMIDYPTSFLVDGFEKMFNQSAQIEYIDLSNKKYVLNNANFKTELKIQRLASVRKVDGILTIPPRYPAYPASILIPAHSKVKILFDQNFVTTAYPSLTFSAGKNAVIRMKYAESLYADDPLLHGIYANKGNRNEFDGKFLVGFNDEIITNGNPNQIWTAQLFRTFRYIQMNIETQDEPLIINEFMAYATGYSFVKKSNFNSNNKELEAIVNNGWHTLKACSHETFYGSPYYDRVTNLNAARVLALASLFNTADTKLIKKVIEEATYSQTQDGYLNLHLYTAQNQIDISQSLSWLGMLIDLYNYSSDSLFVKSMLPAARKINSYFQSQIKSGKQLIGCNFADYTKEWKNVVITTDTNEIPVFFQLYYLYIIREYIQLEQYFGNESIVKQYTSFAKELESNINAKYWDAEKGLFANELSKQTFSQQVNTLAVISDLKVDSLFMHKVLSNKNIIQNSIYFKFFEAQAIAKVGLSGEYLNNLTVWQDQIKQGLTTWAEQIEPSRSDCFGWGVSPNIDFYRILLGINSMQPWFNKVSIKPNLGNLTLASGTVPHYKGIISTKYEYIKKKKRWDIEISIPKGLKGDFIWKNKVYALPDSTSKWSYQENEGVLKEAIE